MDAGVAERQAGAGGRILVVDDHADMRFLLVRYLRAAGFDVSEAEGGWAALERVSRSGFDLILLDVMMPDLDGLEVCERLKASPATASIPVIFATALDDSETRAICAALGAVDVLVKPLNRTDLLRRVERHVALGREEATMLRGVAGEAMGLASDGTRAMGPQAA